MTSLKCVSEFLRATWPSSVFPPFLPLLLHSFNPYYWLVAVWDHVGAHRGSVFRYLQLRVVGYLSDQRLTRGRWADRRWRGSGDRRGFRPVCLWATVRWVSSRWELSNPFSQGIVRETTSDSWTTSRFATAPYTQATDLKNFNKNHFEIFPL